MNWADRSLLTMINTLRCGRDISARRHVDLRGKNFLLSGRNVTPVCICISPSEAASPACIPAKKDLTQYSEGGGSL